MSNAESTTADEQGENTPEQKLTPARSGWDVLTVAVALVALITITIYTARHYGDNATNAATILGIVVPAFATIGAAAFGITVAYNAGQAKGEATGQAAGVAEKAKAVTTARKQAADQLAPALESARSALGRVSGLLSEHSFSPPGQRTMILGIAPIDETVATRAGTIDLQPAPLELDPQPIEEAKQELDRLHGLIESFRVDFE